MAPLLLSYGKALYELAFSQQGVMGKEEVDKTAENGMYHTVCIVSGSKMAKVT